MNKVRMIVLEENIKQKGATRSSSMHLNVDIS